MLQTPPSAARQTVCLSTAASVNLRSRAHFASKPSLRASGASRGGLAAGLFFAIGKKSRGGRVGCSEQTSLSTYDMFLFIRKTKANDMCQKLSSKYEENNEELASPQTSEFHRKKIRIREITYINLYSINFIWRILLLSSDCLKT